MRLRLALAALLGPLLIASAVAAQNLFGPVATVNERVVTGYELQQRVAFNRALGTAGDLEAISLDQLIDDRLRAEAAEIDGIVLEEGAVEEGMEEFAARANLSLPEFLNAIAAEGVAPETFEDFVRAGLLFRGVVQARIAPGVAITPADVDKALERPARTSSLSVRISEIILPADNPERAAQSAALAERLARIRSIPEFAAAAREYSFSPTREAGGAVEALPSDRLPPLIRDAVLGLQPGEVAGPIAVPNAIALFQLRGVDEVVGAPERTGAIDYAAFYIPGGRSPEALAEAARIQASADTCDDLYRLAAGRPAGTLERGTLPVDQIPADIALELARLDAGESSTALTRADGRTLVLLTLCSRNPAPDEEEGEVAAEGEGAAPRRPSRAQVGQRLTDQRIQAQAEAYLDQLRAEATITRP